MIKSGKDDSDDACKCNIDITFFVCISQIHIQLSVSRHDLYHLRVLGLVSVYLAPVCEKAPFVQDKPSLLTLIFVNLRASYVVVRQICARDSSPYVRYTSKWAVDFLLSPHDTIDPKKNDNVLFTT